MTDKDGYNTGIFKEVIGARKDESIAIEKGEHAFTTVNGITKPVITTKGWEILIKWTDSSTSWIPLHIAKESYPIQIAEYVFANQLHNEPAF